MDFGGVAMGGAGGLDFTWYTDIPIVSRLYLTGALLTRAGCALDIVSPFSLYFNFDLVFHQGQLWRLITTFLFFGMIPLDFAFHVYFLVRYCRLLEEGDFKGRTADLVWMMLFGAALMAALAPVAGVHFLGSALSFMVVYVWGRKNEKMKMSTLGGFTYSAPFLPWLMLASSIVLKGHSMKTHAVGILVGHTYHYLQHVYPQVAEIRGWKTKKVLEPPRVLHWICGTYQEPDST